MCRNQLHPFVSATVTYKKCRQSLRPEFRCVLVDKLADVKHPRASDARCYMDVFERTLTAATGNAIG